MVEPPALRVNLNSLSEMCRSFRGHFALDIGFSVLSYSGDQNTESQQFPLLPPLILPHFSKGIPTSSLASWVTSNEPKYKSRKSNFYLHKQIKWLGDREAARYPLVCLTGQRKKSINKVTNKAAVTNRKSTAHLEQPILRSMLNKKKCSKIPTNPKNTL